MNDILISRRDLLKRTAALTAGMSGLFTLGACETLIQDIQNRPVRRNISLLANNDPVVEAYRAAVSAMVALPSSDARNWSNQAQIHANFCPHGNWFFLPWHRAYLVYFERICRKLSGYADFALPYWDWTCAPAIPAHFWGSGNPLTHARNVTSSDSVPTDITGEPIMNSIFALTDFQLFGSGSATQLRPGTGTYGQLEGGPHNGVHGWVGGDMGNITTSPLDPIFWCHHNMLEACWVNWNINMSNPNPSDPTWNSLSLGNMFCDEDGAPVTQLTVAVTSLMPYFSYQFDNQLMPCSSVGNGAAGKVKQWETGALKKFLSEGGPSAITPLQTVSAERPVTMRLNGAATHTLQWPASAVNLLQGTSATQRVLVKARSVESDQAQDSFVRVFVNLPDANAGTSIHDPHFAGSFAFFGGNHMHDGHGMQANFYVDITEALQRLAKNGGMGADRSVSLQFVLVPMHAKTDAASHVTIGAVDLSLSRLH